MDLKLALRTSVIAALLAISFSATSDAQSGRANIQGKVTSAGTPLRSAWVSVSQNSEEKGRAQTGDDGKYYIGYLDAGTFDIVVMSGNRQVFKGQVKLPENATFDIKL